MTRARSFTRIDCYFGAVVVLTVVSACSGRDADARASAARHASRARALRARDGGGAAPVDEGPPKRIFAKKFVVDVQSAPSSTAPKLGYMRAGAILTAKTAHPVERGQEGCLAGWYELETGGFVCNRRDVIAFDGRRPPERRPAQPDLDEALPYKYGHNRRDGTPMYQRPPTDEDAAMYEGYRIPGAETAVVDGGAFGAEVMAASALGGATGSIPIAIAPALSASPLAATVSATVEGASAAPDAGAVGPVTLDSLRGDRLGALRIRMMRGFAFSLDRDLHFGARHYWRTLSNGFVPYSRVFVLQGSAFHGAELDGTTMTLPVAFVVGSHAQGYRHADAARPNRLRRGPGLEYHDVVRIIGDEQIGATPYYVAADGTLYRARDVVRIDPVQPPQGLAQGEKWIDVDLSRQSLVAYEGTRAVFATLISSGRVRDEDNPLLNQATPTGDFRFTSKHISATMDGDHAFDGPYSIEDVPYVMYFQLAYALHSAFWHNRFGRPKSHGCVNMAPLDARRIFNWIGPTMPRGWHGAYPSPANPGTRLIIHGEAREG